MTLSGVASSAGGPPVFGGLLPPRVGAARRRWPTFRLRSGTGRLRSRLAFFRFGGL